MPARADPSLRLSVDWGKVGEIIRTGGRSIMTEMGWGAGPARRDADADKGAASSGSFDDGRWVRWIGATPQVSLVARDWSSASVLVGHLSPTDQIRVSHSSRMLITRVRAAEGRVVPFAQLGAGQWRIDTDVLPTFRPDTELAGQLGAGIDVALAPFVAVALETDYTILYREQHEPQMACSPRFWGSLLAMRGSF